MNIPTVMSRLEVLRHKLDTEGLYVSADTAWLAMEEIKRLRELLDSVIGDEPINQDEMGGCVYCGGAGRRDYSTADPKDHQPTCAWLEGFQYLGTLGENISV